jgi:hypothetical protein
MFMSNTKMIRAWRNGVLHYKPGSQTHWEASCIVCLEYTLGCIGK